MPLDLCTAHSIGTQDGENRRPFTGRNDGRLPAAHFTWFLAMLALRLLLEVVTIPQESTDSLSSLNLFIFSRITRN